MTLHSIATMAAALVLALCFMPHFRPILSDDVDGSIAYLFNHAFHQGLGSSQTFIFPHGPLAFLMYPLTLGKNLLWAFVFRWLVNAVYLYALYQLYGSKAWAMRISVIIAAVLTLALFDLQMILIAIVAITTLLAVRTERFMWQMWSALALIACAYIKAYPFFISASIFYSALIWLCVRRKYRSAGRMLYLPIGMYVIIWLILFRDFEAMGQHLWAYVQLATGNSDASALFVLNNWWFLALGLTTIVLFAVTDRTRDKWAFVAIFGLSLFAQWKYSMARQDVVHARMLFFYLIVLYMAYVGWAKTVHWRSHLWAGLALVFYALNLPNTRLYAPPRLRMTPFKASTEILFDLDSFTGEFSTRNEAFLQAFTLPDSIAQRVGNARIDVYPSQYNYVAANTLNWSFRPVPQSYVSYSQALDRQNANHFASEEAPDFVLWHLSDPQRRPATPSYFSSFDHRSVLNHSPRTTMALARHYEIDMQSEGLLLLRRKSTPLLLNDRLDAVRTITWEEWIDVPKRSTVPIASISFSANALGRIKATLFKSEGCFVYAEDVTGQISVYRIVKDLARDRIFLVPNHVTSPMCLAPIRRVMLKTTDPAMMRSAVEITWIENDEFAEWLSSLWQMDPPCPDAMRPAVVEHQAPAETIHMAHHEYVPIFHASTDSLQCLIEAVQLRIWFRSKTRTGTWLAVQWMVDGEVQAGHQENIDDFLINPFDWNTASRSFARPEGLPESTTVKGFLWNPERQSFQVDRADWFLQCE